MFLTSTGKLMRFDEKYRTDNGTVVTWLYETGITYQQRLRLTGMEIKAYGGVRVTVCVDDGANGSLDYLNTTELGDTPKYKLLNLNANPGIGVKIRISGDNRYDRVESCTLIFEDAGDGNGS